MHTSVCKFTKVSGILVNKGHSEQLMFCNFIKVSEMLVKSEQCKQLISIRFIKVFVRNLFILVEFEFCMIVRIWCFMCCENLVVFEPERI